MTLSRTATAAIAAALFLAPAFAPTETQAAPITYTATGTIDSNGTITSTGTFFSGFLNLGDAYTFTLTVDPSLTPSAGEIGSTYSYADWTSGISASLSINGHTFTIGDQLTLNTNIAEAGDSVNEEEYLFYSGVEHTDQHATNPGSATSTLAGVDRFSIGRFQVYDSSGVSGNDVLDFNDPRFPQATSLSDYDFSQLDFTITDFDMPSNIRFRSGNQAFTSFEVTAGGSESSGGEGVPAPGALVLLGMGLFGLGAARKRNAAH